MARDLTDPRLVTVLADAFPLTVTIQEATPTQDAVGQPIASWANKTSHVDIACCRYSTGGQETRRPDQTVTTAGVRLLLQGYYSAITTAMRAVSGGVTYNILAVEQDSQHLATRLVVEVVT